MSDTPERDYRLFTQKYSALMDGAFALFFEGESLLSELTINESLGNKEQHSLLAPQDLFAQSEAKLNALIELIENSSGLLSELWYRKFYDEQLDQLQRLR